MKFKKPSRREVREGDGWMWRLAGWLVRRKGREGRNGNIVKRRDRKGRDWEGKGRMKMEGKRRGGEGK